MKRRDLHVVGHDVWKVDGRMLVTGTPAFTDDFPKQGMLAGKLLRSPHAHARIRSIDASRARALPGVHAVLTCENVVADPDPSRKDQFRRIAYTRAGQDYPEPSPWDYFLLDRKVRYVGDRVAAVAADTDEIAREAIGLIDVDYEMLPALFTPEEAWAEGAPVIHDEEDCENVLDRTRNHCAGVDVGLGDVKAGLAGSDVVVEGTYRTHRMQHAQMELHACITYLDGDGRLVVICTTQVPFHVRRQLARVLGLPIGRVRVIKPRLGGGFGGKQELVLEDISCALTLVTGRPVRMEMTRFEDLNWSRSRHPMKVDARVGAKKDGTLQAIEMIALVEAGAYGSHSSTVPTNTGNKNLPRYRCANVRFKYDAIYTNLPITGAMRGYGTTQGAFALESEIDELAERLGVDPVEYRLGVTIREGEKDRVSPRMYEAKIEGPDAGWPIDSCGLAECIEKGAEAIGWKEKRARYTKENGSGSAVRKGIGMCCLSQGSGVAGIDSANATIKLNEDGSINLMIGASDLGTGADTVMAKIAAETLGLRVEDVVVYATDTDIVPFDSGAYASSTTYVSGGATLKAAERVRADLLEIAAEMMGEKADDLDLVDRHVVSHRSSKKVPIGEVALFSAYKKRRTIEYTANHVSPVSPPPFAAVYADIEVNAESGELRVVEMVSAVDAGKIINPKLAEGQVHGALHMGLGYALTEQLLFDGKGRPLNRGLGDYRIFRADGMPRMTTILVETYEPTGPYGAKAIAEIPVNGPAPSIGNALKHALGVRIREIPFTPERILRATGKM